MNTAGSLGGFVCSLVFGHAVKAVGSYNVPLVMVGVAVLIAAALFSRIDPTKPIEN